MPQRYAISEFLMNPLLSHNLSSIRSIFTYSFGQVSKAAVDTAQQDWLKTVDYAISYGLNLSRLHISGYSYDGHLDKQELEAAAPSDEEKFEWARRCVREILWPLTDAGIPRAISGELFVELTFDEVKILYELRKDGRDIMPNLLVRLENERGPEIGQRHRGTRELRGQLWEEEETWIETAWVRALDSDEVV